MHFSHLLLQVYPLKKLTDLSATVASSFPFSFFTNVLHLYTVLSETLTTMKKLFLYTLTSTSKKLLSLSLTLALLFSFTTTALAEKEKTIFSADALLICPDLTLNENLKTQLTELLEHRKSVVAKYTKEEFGEVITFFGIRSGIPEEMMKTLDDENAKIRSILSPSELKQATPFQKKYARLVTKAARTFPIKGTPDIDISQFFQNDDNGKRLVFETIAFTGSELYTLDADYKQKKGENTASLYITVTRPSLYELGSVEHNPAIEIKKQISLSDNFPSTVRIHVRQLDAELPFTADYHVLGDINVAELIASAETQE